MRILSLFLVVFALTGCSGTTIGGNEDKLTPAYLKQHLIVGKTTKAEVRQYFGAPDSGHTTVTYDQPEGRQISQVQCCHKSFSYTAHKVAALPEQ